MSLIHTGKPRGIKPEKGVFKTQSPDSIAVLCFSFGGIAFVCFSSIHLQISQRVYTFVHYNVRVIMVVISSAELRNNMKKYLDLARTQRVVIQRGRDESFVLIAQNNAPEADLARAITVDDVIDRVREGLTQMFERKEADRSA